METKKQPKEDTSKRAMRRMIVDIEDQINAAIIHRAGKRWRSVFAAYHRGERPEPTLTDYLRVLPENELEHIRLARENIENLRAQLDAAPLATCAATEKKSKK